MNRQKNLSLFRRIRRVTQDQLDELTNSGKGVTWAYENGKAKPPDGYLKKISPALGISDWHLFDADDPLNTPREDLISVPYWGIVPCGDWETPSDSVEEVAVPARLKDMDVIAVRVMGESMAPMLRTGDLLPIKLTKRAHDGAVVLVRNENNDLTLKVARHRGRWEFHPLNPAFEQVHAERIDLIGILVMVPERFDPSGISVL